MGIVLSVIRTVEDKMNHERCRLNPRYMTEYGAKLGSLAINTALTVKHEVFPPKPDKPEPFVFTEPPVNRGVAPFERDSELVILDDENAEIRITND